jgi:hypothetical protein
MYSEHTDRLDGTIAKEQYLEKQAVIQQELCGIRRHRQGHAQERRSLYHLEKAV